MVVGGGAEGACVHRKHPKYVVWFLTTQDLMKYSKTFFGGCSVISGFFFTESLMFWDNLLTPISSW